MRRFSPANVRAAWWALRTGRRTRKVLDREGLDAALRPPPPPPLPEAAGRGMRTALRRMGGSCLVNAIVEQAWDAAMGRPRDLVIGVARRADGFDAHAWLSPGEGDPGEYVELTRRPASQPRPADPARVGGETKADR